MALIEKIADKNEYEIKDYTLIRGDLSIGGKDAVGFEPILNMSWDAETGSEQYFLELDRKDPAVETGKDIFSDNSISLPTGDMWGTGKDGSLKWDIKYFSDPRVVRNTDFYVYWKLNSSHGIDFRYQPALDPIKNPLDAFGSRPEKFENSYAVYCDKAHNSPKGKFYCGKLFHIPRPLCIDAVGKVWWADIYIDQETELLRIKIPYDCLDSCVYPLILDPEIGISAEGATTWSNNSITIGNETVAGDTFDIDTINVFTRNTSGDTNYDIKLAALDDVTGTPTNLLAAYVTHEITSAETSNAWHQIAYSGSVVSGNTFYCCGHPEVSAIKLLYDAGATDYKTETYAASITGGGSWTDSGSFAVSIYCEGAGGGGGGNPWYQYAQQIAAQ